MKKLLSVVLLTVLILALAVPALAAGSKTNPVEIVETLYEGEHQDWTETDPSVVPTPDDASEATGVPEDQTTILWTVDYDTENFPVEIEINAPGTDNRTLYVLEYIDGKWTVIGSGVGPTIRVPVTQKGTISLVAYNAATPAKDQTQTAPKTGEGWWLAAAAAVTVAAFGGAIALKRRREQ